MTEKEKMRSGEFYDTRDSELRRLSGNAKDLMRVYNSLPAENMELRNRILRLLFGFCGENARVNQPVWVDYGCHISLGAGSLINMNCTLLDTGRITIGDNTLLGPDVKIYTAVHPVSADERMYTDACGRLAIRTRTADVTIGSHVWIGGRGRHPAGHHHRRQCRNRRGKRGHTVGPRECRRLRESLHCKKDIV